MNLSYPILVYLAAALIITRIPYIGTYFSICYRLLHEVIRTLISGGKRKRIRLVMISSIEENANQLKMDKLPLIEKPSTLKNDLISYISYTVTLLASIGLFYLISINDYYLILYLLIGLTAASIVLWIRRIKEILWALSFIALLAFPIYISYEAAVMHSAIFLASFIVIQSVLHAFDLFRQSWMSRKRKRMIAKMKGIPSMILGLIQLGQALYASYFIIRHFIFHTGIPWSTFAFLQLS